MSQIVGLSGVSRDTINKWLERGLFKTPIPATTPGVARAFSRENALEIMFAAALAQVGVGLDEASEKAQTWMGRLAEGNLERYWSRNPLQGMTDGFRDREFGRSIGIKQLADYMEDRVPNLGEDECYRPAGLLIIVDRQELVARIDSLTERAA